MGLENFIDGLDGEDNKDTEDTKNQNSEKDETYRGDDELLDIAIEDVDSVLNETELNFESTDMVISGLNRATQSPDDSYVMVVSYPRESHNTDCLKVHVLESDSMYDVIDPYEIYMVDGWEKELKQAIQTVRDNSDEIMFCPRCGSVMILRTTNGSGKRIRGCSDYPNCKYSENP